MILYHCEMTFIILVAFFALKSIFSDIKVLTSALLWLVLVWFIFCYSFIFDLCVSLFKVGILWAVGSSFLIQYDNL